MPKPSTTLLEPDSASFRSISTRKEYLLSSIYFLAATVASPSPFSQVCMKRNCTSGLSLNLFTAICIAGNDRLHGPHQVDQKSSTTVLPFKLSELTVLPFTSFNSQVGPGLLTMVFFRL